MNIINKRICTTIGLWSIIIASVAFLGPIGGVGLLAMIGLLALNELYEALAHMGYQPLKPLGLILGTGLIIGAYTLPITGSMGGGLLGLVVTFFCCLSLYKSTSTDWLKKKLMPTLLGILIVPFNLQFFCLIAREQATHGLTLVIWVVAVAKFTDVGGLVGGYFLGYRPLCPHISPKKTWEGLWVGMLCAVVTGAVFFLLGRSFLPATLTWPIVLTISPIIAVFSVLSDLFESVIKRMAQVKDSGHILPGIGGALDLVDSLLMVGPVAYWLLHITLSC